MKKLTIFHFIISASLFISCAKVKSPAPEIANNSTQVELKDIKKTEDPFLSSSKFRTEAEFVVLKKNVLEDALNRIDQEKIDFEKSFTIKGNVFEKQLVNYNYNCKYEVGNSDIIVFGKELVSKISVSYITKYLSSYPDIDYCTRIGKTLNNGHALVFNKPDPARYLSLIKEAFYLKTKDIFNILSVNGNRSELFGIGLEENQSNLMIKIFGNKGTIKNLFKINLDTFNPEIIFDSKISPAAIRELDLDQFPDQLSINVYRFDLFYAGNFSMKDFDNSVFNLKQYINNQLQ